MDSREDSHLVLVDCELVLPADDDSSFHLRNQEGWLVLYLATMEAVMVERTKTVDELEAQPHLKQAPPATDLTPYEFSTIRQFGRVLGQYPSLAQTAACFDLESV